MRYRELIETDDDDDLFGGQDRASPTPEQAVAKFKMFFPAVKRVSWSRMNFRVMDELFGFSNDNRFHAGESHSRHSYWSTQAYTNRETGLGLLIYEDSGQGTWAYIGAHDREGLAGMIQQLVAADQLEDPEAAKQRRLAKQQARAATVEKKGIRVGTRIDIGHGITAEVVEIKPTTGKVVMRDITGDRIGHEREYSVYQISKRMIMNETDNDDDLFGVITRVWEFQGHEQEMDDNADYIKDEAEDLGLQFLGRHEYENWVVAYEFKGREEALEELDSLLRNNLGDGYGGAEPVNMNESDSDDDLFAQRGLERINFKSIELDGIDRRDYPDFADAHVSYAEFKDGTPLDDAQLEELTNELMSSGELNSLVHDSLYESDDDDELFGRTRMWYVNIWGNYNDGRYYDYGPRRYTVPGTTANDALNYLKNNADQVYAYMDTQRFPNKKRVVARPARDNVFLDKSTVDKEAVEGATSAIERFIRSRRAIQ